MRRQIAQFSNNEEGNAAVDLKKTYIVCTSLRAIDPECHIQPTKQPIMRRILKKIQSWHCRRAKPVHKQRLHFSFREMQYYHPERQCLFE